MIILICIIIFFISLTGVFLFNFFKKKRNSESFAKDFCKENIITVKLKNNNKDFIFLLDTGANTSFIDKSVISNIVGYTKVGEALEISTAGSSILATPYKIPFTFKHKTSKLEFCVTDFKNAIQELHSTEGEIVGVVGTNFLAEYGIAIDFNTFTLYSQ